MRGITRPSLVRTRSASSLDRTEGSDNMKPRRRRLHAITSTRLQCSRESPIHRPLSSAIEVIPEDDDT
jgi:hypothetical protein